MLSVDNMRAEQAKTPIFCVEATSFDDGGSTQYIGVLYQVYHIKQIEMATEPMTIDYGYYVVPWFVTLDYLKQMLEIS
jgi:hypothetical protein